MSNHLVVGVIPSVWCFLTILIAKLIVISGPVELCYALTQEKLRMQKMWRSHKLLRPQ